MHQSLSLLSHALGVLGLDRDDVLLVSFPKSGSTWVRFLLCNLIRTLEGEEGPAGFAALDATMPELGASNLFRRWSHQPVPRVVKTHRSYQALIARTRNVHVVRDFRDVMVSYFRFRQRVTRRPFHGPFSDFIRHPRFGLNACLGHFLSWRARAQHTMYYENLRADDLGEFGKLLDYLQTDVPAESVVEAVRRSRFEVVRKVEADQGMADPGRVEPGFQFARKGSSGQWHDHFSPSDTRYYQSLKESLGVEVY